MVVLHLFFSATTSLYMKLSVHSIVIVPTFISYSCKYYLIQNSQAVKKECGPEKGYSEKRCEIQGGGQEMAVMVG